MYNIPLLTTVLVPSHHGIGHYHIKGLGESPLTPVAPAIARETAAPIYRAHRPRPRPGRL